MTDGIYLGEDYKHNIIRNHIKAFIWAEPEWYAEEYDELESVPSTE